MIFIFCILEGKAELPPNMRMQPMPLRVNKIRSILAAASATLHSRFNRAARLMRVALGGHEQPMRWNANARFSPMIAAA
jgi:hypothetical protein